MKKLFFTVATMIATSANAQWVVKTINNGFDAPTKMAYTEDGQRPYLKLEQYEGAGVLIFKGIYFCEGPIFIEMSFQVNGENKKYGRIAELNDAETTAFISWDIKNEDFFSDFKNCTSVKVRVTDTGCESGEIYTFKMNGSTAAVNFITTP